MFKRLINKINNTEKVDNLINKLILDEPYDNINVGEIDVSKIVYIDGMLYHEDDLTTKNEESIFDVLDGFKAVEVLEQSQDILITRFENNEGDEKIITQTENEINIRWDE